MSSEQTAGKTAYIAYRSQMGGRTYDDRPMPTWEELPDNVRAGWTAAGAWVRRETLAEVIVLLQEQLRADIEGGRL